MATINQFGWNRILRIALGVTMLVLGWSGIASGPAGLFMQWFGFLPLISGLAGTCPTVPFFNTGSSCSMKTDGSDCSKKK